MVGGEQALSQGLVGGHVGHLHHQHEVRARGDSPALLHLGIGHSLLVQRLDPKLKALGLTAKQVTIMWLVEANPAITQIEIGRFLAIERSTIHQFTRSLVKNGSGDLLLSGANTYSGNTYVNAGLLDFTNISMSGFGGGSGRNIYVAPGAAVVTCTWVLVR